YLKTYEDAIDRTGKTLESLRQLIGNDPHNRERIAALRQRVDARFGELRRAIAAQKAEGFSAAKMSVSTNRGRQLMNEMRALVNEMQEQEQESLRLRADESQQSAFVAHATDVVGAIFGIGMVGLAFILFGRDLANRQRVEEATRRLAAIVECSDDAILRKTLDGIIVSWNAGAEQLYGYTAEEAVGRRVTMLCPPERFDEVYQQLDRVKQGIPIEHFETTRIRKDGERIEVSLSISPVKDAQGHVIGAAAIARDVTEKM